MKGISYNMPLNFYLLTFCNNLRKKISFIHSRQRKKRIMLINTSHLVSSDISNNDKTRYLIESNSDYSNYSNTSQEFEPVWITLSLISSK